MRISLIRKPNLACRVSLAFMLRDVLHRHAALGGYPPLHDHGDFKLALTSAHMHVQGAQQCFLAPEFVEISPKE